MGFEQNHTEPLDSAGPDTHWESTSPLSAIAVDTIVALGGLTFALQLCLVLYFLLRCWRLDNKVREALRQNHHKPQLTGPLLHLNLCTPAKHPLCESTTSISTMPLESHDHYEPAVGVKSAVLGPSIPWDLVQC